MKKNNIILIGMMGSGKTTVGAELKKVLSDYKYIDIDNEIEKGTQKKISDIFLQHGEAFFRILETKKIRECCKDDARQIISIGGGAFEFEENRKNLLKNGVVIYLKTSPEEIYNRIKNQTHRPLLRKDFSVEKIINIIKMREKNYKLANYTIDTTGKTPQNIVKEILGVVE